MRILLVNHEFTVTGASTMLLRLAEHLRASGYEVTVFAFVVTPGPVKESYLARGFTVLDTVDFKDYELAICNTTFTAKIVVQAAPFAKTIWWIHETETGLYYLLQNLPLLRAFSNATAVVYQTPFQRDVVFRSLTYLLDPGKFSVIPNGVDIEATDFRSAPAAPKRRAIRVVSVGTVEPRKRHEDLIYAVDRLKSLDIECVICGNFVKLAPNALNIVGSSPDRFMMIPGLPHRECLALIGTADIFCLASASESQPLVVFEAAFMARPLLLSSLLVYEGIFRHAGNCLLFPTGNVELLAQGLTDLAGSGSLRERLGRAARKTARSYTMPAFRAAFDALLERIMA